MKLLHCTAIIAVVTLVVLVSVSVSAVSSSSSSSVAPSRNGLVPNSNIPQSAGFVIPVKNLPGLPEPIPTPFFSGMLGIRVPKIHQHPSAPDSTVQSMYMHYTIAAPTNLDNVSDVVVFVSGGPGAPTLWASFVEYGPYKLNEQSYTTENYKRTGIPEPILNPYSWTNRAVIVAMDNPPPTGFSYCGCDGEHNASDCGVTGGFGSCGTWNDTRVGVAMAESLRVLFSTHFPNLLTGRILRFVSESYGGTYAAATSEQLFTDAKYSFVTDRLASVSNGDACMGYDRVCGNPLESEPWWRLMFMFGRGQLSTELWNNMMAVCGGEAGLKRFNQGGASTACKAAVEASHNAIGVTYTYNLFDNCPDNEFRREKTADASMYHEHRSGSSLSVKRQQQQRKNNKKFLRAAPKHLVSAYARHLPHSRQVELSARHFIGNTSVGRPQVGYSQPPVYLNGYYCPAYVFDDYFSIAAAKVALGVSASSVMNIADNAVGMSYVFNLADGFAIYKALLLNVTHFGGKPLNRRKVPLMVGAYNADSDPSVNMVFTEHVWYEFARNMTAAAGSQFAKTQEWHQFFYRNDPSIGAGYIVRWGPKGGDSVTYTIGRGAGHMYPEFNPRGSQAFFEHLLDS